MLVCQMGRPDPSFRKKLTAGVWFNKLSQLSTAFIKNTDDIYIHVGK
jgi:hypothetical protein